MRFRAEHELAAPVADVIALLTSPDFHRGLELPDLSLPEVLAAETDGDRAHLQLRYEFVGKLDPIAARLLGGRKLMLVQDLDVDTITGTGSLRFVFEAEPKRLHAQAEVAVSPKGPDAAHSVRRIDGELVVAVFGVGGTAERRLLPGVLRRLDIEAAELDRQLAG